MSPPLHYFSLAQPRYLKILLALAVLSHPLLQCLEGLGLCPYIPSSHLLTQTRVLQGCLPGLKQCMVSPFWTKPFVCPPSSPAATPGSDLFISHCRVFFVRFDISACTHWYYSRACFDPVICDELPGFSVVKGGGRGAKARLSLGCPINLLCDLGQGRL